MTHEVVKEPRTRATRAKANKRSERIELRVDEDTKNLFLRAAESKGVLISEFIRETVTQKAMEVVNLMDILSLNDEARSQFLEALENPPEPNSRLRDEYRKYLEQS